MIVQKILPKLHSVKIIRIVTDKCFKIILIISLFTMAHHFGSGGMKVVF